MKFKVGDKVLYRHSPDFRGRIRGISPSLITVIWKGGHLATYSKSEAREDLKVIK